MTLILIAVLSAAPLGIVTTAPFQRNPAIPAPGQQPSADAGIRAELKRMADAWNAADMAGHMAPYADSATMMGARGPMVGRDTIQTLLKGSFWKDEKATQNLRFENVVVRPLGGSHALATGHFILSGGGAQERSGWFSTVWELSKGKWRILHDHSS